MMKWKVIYCLTQIKKWTEMDWFWIALNLCILLDENTHIWSSVAWKLRQVEESWAEPTDLLTLLGKVNNQIK